ncbi:MAG TPA: hypothetical protein PK528_04750, partial [Syntrophorhabdus sp.]|nr:hypothetical protein [Syntrophorhabdus sp.]
MKLLADFHQEEIDENRQKVQKVPGKSLPGSATRSRRKMFRRVGDSVGDDGQTKKKGPEYLPNPLIYFGVPTGSRTPV